MELLYGHDFCSIYLKYEAVAGRYKEIPVAFDMRKEKERNPNKTKSKLKVC